MPNKNDLAHLIQQSSDMDWLHGASCASLGVDELDLFFVEAGKSLSKQAVSMCKECPARAACLRHAYDNEIAGGYFGGMSPSQRRKVDLTAALELIGETVTTPEFSSESG